MKKTFLSIFILFALTPNSGAAETSLFDTNNLHQMNFFEGSIRRNPQGKEILTFLKLIYDENTGDRRFRPICAGFRVQQKSNRFFVATARHCFDFKETEACEKKQIQMAPADSSGGYYFGTCKKIIASSDESDLFVMEMQIETSFGPATALFEAQVKETFPSYYLASYIPNPGVPLIVSGFPKDSIRRANATITEKCEILPAAAQDSIYALKPDDQKKIRDIFEKEKMKLSEFFREKLSKLNRTFLKHNCSVYLGNSGGPGRIEGSHDIVGIQHDSWKGFFKSVPRHFARNMEPTAPFVQRHRDELEDEGVVISDSEPKVQLRPLPNYFKKSISI